MARSGWFAPLATFTVWPATVISVLSFVAVLFSSIFFFEELPSVPKPTKQHGVSLDQAYSDLQTITARAHPYNSHQNDLVHTYVLERVQAIAKEYSDVHVDDDMISNATWASGNTAIYYESNNVLVHIVGTSSMPAVLFSAHYDSVSTAPGATDDGMGVATLLQLVEYFAKNKPKRDIVFNINNGEEDGLNGARVFMTHPWSSLPSSFLNLEGAGGGGRPLLFRSSSIAVARAFRSAPHPHGNVLAQDSFNRGLIRSGTDWSVYTDAGIPGLDLAFYKRRAVYHTKDDSIPTLAGKEALWNMLESALYTGIALASDGNLDDHGGDQPAVFFDLFGEVLLVTAINNVLALNIVFLAAGPIIIGMLILLASRKSKLYWTGKGWFRFPLSFALGLAAPIGLAFLVSWANPDVVYGSPYWVLTMMLSASFTFMYLPLRFLAHYRPILRQKTIVLLQLYILTWALLVFNTVLVSIPKIGGMYFVTFFHIGILASLVVGLSEHFELPPALKTRLVKKNRPDDGGSDGEQQPEDTEDVGQEPTETTPLIPNGEEEGVRELDVDEENQYLLWALQFLLAAPFSMILLTQMSCLALASLQNTLADGNPAIFVYVLVGAASFFTILPIAPFAHKLHRGVAGLALTILVISILFNLFAFPFSTFSPLKIRFSQEIDLDTGSQSVHLTGLPKYVERYVVPELPSSAGRNVTCADRKGRSGLRACSWEGPSPVVAPGKPDDWIHLNATLLKPGYGRLTLGGNNTRFCTVEFDTAVHNLGISGGNGFGKQYPIPETGVTSLELWSRTWNREFIVEFSWDGDSHTSGRAACGWDDASTIPALNEVITFAPSWSTVTKDDSGLVKVFRKFTL